MSIFLVVLALLLITLSLTNHAPGWVGLVGAVILAAGAIAAIAD